MNLFFTLILVAVILAALLFFKYFTKNGTVALPIAWRSFVVWASACGAVLGQFIVEGLAWLAGIWDPFRAQFGELLSSDSAGQALQIVSAIFFLLRMKGQGFPSFRLPPVPDNKG
ncbi:hypothetical protein [Pseudoxanthomonas sp. SE1]|uniref:hypothetical protein n=1 Tax=Pseudoxanthomonas sp. SE1 TaxID=1664560 RepID=UPI00240E0523|nr:hypothetical protein [Pseudoxanthomonas sp. SE1]WFC43250.1 hypothetical protein OY559_06990 [Pseudoxanthomonas sp. SE1]